LRSPPTARSASGRRSRRYGLQTRRQRCWGAQDRNNKLPKSQQPKAKRALQEIWMDETRKDALVAFVETLAGQIRQGGRVPNKDRDALLAFYDFPAEH
jgi:hypothetical protein